MELKKNPNIDAKRNSLLYFQIGLIAITILTYVALELKTLDPVFVQEKVEIVDNFVDEEVIPMTMQVQKAPPPPPPPPAPEVIQVVKDEVVIKNEKKIETTDTNENQEVNKAPVVQASSVGTAEVGVDDVDVDVPFTILEDVPLFPGCENVKGAENQRKCFGEQISKHVIKYFSYPSKAQEDNIQGRVIVQFIIDKTGTVTNLRIKGTGKPGSELLEAEAERIIKKLPKFTPGRQRGKPVSVSYAQPIFFKLETR